MKHYLLHQNIKRTRRSVARLLFVALLVVILPQGGVLAHQQGSLSDPYRTELLDWSIAVSGPNYTLIDVALEEYPHGRGERIYIASVESLGFVEISLFDDADSPQDTIEVMLRDFSSASQSLTVLDSGLSNEMHYAFARFQLDQGPAGYFYVEVAEDIDGNVDLMQSIYTLDADFLEQLETARSEITMNGLAFLNVTAIDLEALVENDQMILASTPEPVATPQVGTYIFDSYNTELVVNAPIEFDFPFTNDALEVIFLRSEHGYGVVGYITQEVDSASAVIASVFVGAPGGAEAPTELYSEADESFALGIYRVLTQGESRAMVIEVSRINADLWTVQAIAVEETAFPNELQAYQNSVTFDGEPFLQRIEENRIVSILNQH